MSPDDPREAPLGELLTGLARRVGRRGRLELERVAHAGRLRLELRQARSDLDDFWIRMGKTAFRLSQAGEVEHPALERAQRRIEQLLAHIDELEGRLPPDEDHG